MTTEDLWFRIIIIIALIAFLVLFIANAVYYNKLRNGNCTAVTNSEANLMFWLNLIWCVVVGIMLIWAIVRIFIRPKPSVSAAVKGLDVSPSVAILPPQAFTAPPPEPSAYTIAQGPTQIVPQGQQQFQGQLQQQQFQGQFPQQGAVQIMSPSSASLSGNDLPANVQPYLSQGQNLF
jgi:hypothetical protein